MLQEEQSGAEERESPGSKCAAEQVQLQLLQACTDVAEPAAASSKADADEPVDMALQNLLETEGSAQPERSQLPAAAPSQPASVEALFASELGLVSSRFSQPKSQGKAGFNPSSAGTGTQSAAPNSSGAHALGKRPAAAVQVLVLKATHGPATGRFFVADDDSVEVSAGMWLWRRCLHLNCVARHACCTRS